MTLNYPIQEHGMTIHLFNLLYTSVKLNSFPPVYLQHISCEIHS